MKIKCPYCKVIYDPEVQDNTCPACNKKLLVTVFKKPAVKPGATSGAMYTKAPPAPAPTMLNSRPPVEPAQASAPAAAVAAPTHKPPTAELKPILVMPAPAKPAPAPVVAPPPPPATDLVEPEVLVEEEYAPVASAHGPAQAGYDLVISIQKAQSTDWDAVIRVPVHVFKLANLVPARAREAIQSEGIDFDELRKAVEQADHVGPLLDIQTLAERIQLSVELHEGT